MTGNPEGVELPWSDCKVAYSIDDTEGLWKWAERHSGKLPTGWSLNETDCSGARAVAIFRVDCLLTVDDGEKVAKLIKRFQ